MESFETYCPPGMLLSQYRSMLQRLNSITAIAELERGSSNNSCLRKAVICEFWNLDQLDSGTLLCSASNGPVHGRRCKNIQGGCGCFHAEPRAVSDLLWILSRSVPMRATRITMLCSYVPCSACARSIVTANDLITNRTLNRVGIREAVCLYPTPHDLDGGTILSDSGIHLTQIHSTEPVR